MKHPLLDAAKNRLHRIACVAGALILGTIVVACGGSSGDYTPFTGVAIRPLDSEFSTRKAVAYSPYRTAADKNGLDAEVIPPANIKEDLDLLIAAGYGMIRLFSSDDKVAKQTLQVIADNNLNLRVQLGAYIVGDTYTSAADKPTIYAKNDASIAQAVALATNPTFKNLILAVSIGNETQVDFSGVRTNPDTLAGYIRTVRKQITQPVTTDDNWYAWSTISPLISNEIDFVSIHTYPELDTVFNPTLFNWQQRNVAEADRAVAMMNAVIAEAKRQYGAVRSFFDNKGLSYIPITVGETGWNAVNKGALPFRAHPVNQKMYVDRLNDWAADGRAGNGPKAIFYFEAFDEAWKQGDDKWGLFNKQRHARYVIKDLFPSTQWVQAQDDPNEPATASLQPTDAVYFVPPVVNSPITQTTYMLYTDNAAGTSEFRPVGLRWDAFDGTTAGYQQVAAGYAPGDAPNSLEITPQPASYGWGLLRQSPTAATDNLSEYAANGTINFWISTTYPGKIEIGISTDTQDRVPQEAYLQIQPGNYGYCSTGAWCQVSIPLKDFVSKNPKLDLSLVLSRFIISDVYSRTGNTAGSTAKLYIDDIYWSK